MEWIVFIILAINFIIAINRLRPLILKQQPRLRSWQMGEGVVAEPIMETFRAQIREQIRQRQSVSSHVEKVNWKKEGF